MYRWPLMGDTVTKRDRLKMAWFCLTTGKFTAGQKVSEFEAEWADWVGSEYALFVSSGSTANTLLVESWKETYHIPDGAKVVVPACTWVTNIAPIIQANLQPVFCDINLDDFSFDKNALQDVKRVHPDIAAVFVTHLLGYPSDVSMIAATFPDAHILEDVCESHGATLKGGKMAGTHDVGGTFSFYFGHHMTTIEGGMVVTDRPDLYDMMRMKRAHGLARESFRHSEYSSENPDVDPKFLFMTDGHNFRNNEIGAVLGKSQLKRLDDMIEKRMENYFMWHDVMANYHHKFIVPDISYNCSNFAFPFIAQTKEIHEKFSNLLTEYDVEYRPVVSGNLLRQPFLRGKGYGSPEAFRNAEVLHERGLYVGNSHFVNDYHLDMLFEILKQL